MRRKFFSDGMPVGDFQYRPPTGSGDTRTHVHTHTHRRARTHTRVHTQTYTSFDALLLGYAAARTT